MKAGRIDYVQGSPERLTADGHVEVKRRNNDTKERIGADLIIMATGFNRPSMDFLSADDGTELFPEDYDVRAFFFVPLRPANNWCV